MPVDAALGAGLFEQALPRRIRSARAALPSFFWVDGDNDPKGSEAFMHA
jgi:hypothetical protein